MGTVEVGQGARIVDHHTEESSGESEVLEAIGLHMGRGVAEVGVEILAASQSPAMAVFGGIYVDLVWHEDPVEGMLEESHGDTVYRRSFAQIQHRIDIVAPIALPMAIGIGVVGTELAIEQCSAAASAIGIAVGGIFRAELSESTYTFVAQGILAGVGGFVPLIVAHGFHLAGAVYGEGAAVGEGGLGGLAAIGGIIDGQMAEERGERHECLPRYGGAVDKDVTVGSEQLGSDIVEMQAHQIAAIRPVFEIPKCEIFALKGVEYIYHKLYLGFAVAYKLGRGMGVGLVEVAAQTSLEGCGLQTMERIE